MDIGDSVRMITLLHHIEVASVQLAKAGRVLQECAETLHDGVRAVKEAYGGRPVARIPLYPVLPDPPIQPEPPVPEPPPAPPVASAPPAPAKRRRRRRGHRDGQVWVLEGKTKRCANCRRVKSVGCFSGHADAPTGLQSWCKNCKKDYGAKDRAEKKARAAAQPVLKLEMQ